MNCEKGQTLFETLIATSLLTAFAVYFLSLGWATLHSTQKVRLSENLKIKKQKKGIEHVLPDHRVP